MDQLVRINSPAIAPLAPSQDTTSDQLSIFYRPQTLPITRHSPLPVASLAPVNANANTTVTKVIEKASGGGGTVFSGVSSLNSLTGALAIQSAGTILVGTAGADVTVDVVSATSSQLGAIELNTDLGGTAIAPQVVATHLASPLPVNQGGSGTTTPSLVAGSSINITGSWPNQTIINTGTGQVPINSSTYKALSGTVAVSATTLTIIDTVSVTFPSSGGPWRVFVQCTYYKSGGVNYHWYIKDDLANGWGGGDMVTQNNITGLFSGGGFSPVTYANSATRTFTVEIYDTGNSTIQLTSRIFGSSLAVSNMQVTVFSSN